MKCKVRSAVREYGMLQKGHVLLALSGGADSMSLLHVLLSLRDEFGFALEAAHVNHGLRGAESDADEAFVRKVCASFDIPLHVLQADVAAEAKRTGESLEACGRRIRYAYLRSVSKGEIATAHTADDNVETVLLHWTRGAGLQGLCGIAPKRDGLIRPLIGCTRADVEAYCAENRIPFVTDSSNLSDDYARNRLRHAVVPTLRQINPAVTDAAFRCGASLREDADYLSAQTEALLRKAAVPFGYDARMLRESHPALQNRALMRILSKRMHRFPDAKDIRAAVSLLTAGGAVQTEKDVTLCVHGGVLYFDRPLRPAWKAEITDGKAVLPHGSAEIQIIDAKNTQNIHIPDLANCLCCDTIHGNLFFRSRQAGDTMTRVNSACRKSMKQLFQEQRIPAPYRADVPILTDGTRVLWAYGLGCDEAYAVRETSGKIMVIHIMMEGEECRKTF